MQAVPVVVKHFGCEACGRITHLRAMPLRTYSGACEHCGMWLSFEDDYVEVHQGPAEDGES